MSFHYHLFGLHLESELDLPELRAIQTSRLPDVRIRLEALPPPNGQGDELVVDGNSASFFIDGVAHYEMSSGRVISVDPQPGSDSRNIRLFLLGSAMGVLLHQRGHLPIHANAVEIDGQAVAFMGPSGAGKSTLAAAFHDCGRRIIADDVCAIGFDHEGFAVANAGIPRLRLWEDALTASGRAARDYVPSVSGDDQYRKFDVPTAGTTAPVRLSAIVELADGRKTELTRLTGVEAVNALFANTYRGTFVASTGDAKVHWETCLRLVESVRVLRLHRPKTVAAIAEIVSIFGSPDWEPNTYPGSPRNVE
jgi:hypothetical protein